MRIAIFGAAPDTSNMGVSALFRSIVEALLNNVENLEILSFDNGSGYRRGYVECSRGRLVPATYYGARGGTKYYLPENLARMSVLSKLGSVARKLSRGIRELDTCDAVFDVSGGDSFSDIYGRKRFLSTVRPKLISISRNVPLFLVPQTYGPFHSARYRRKARAAAAGATMAWARDSDSFDALQQLLGTAFCPSRHRLGVDMAFGLPAVQAEQKVEPWMAEWLLDRSSGIIRVGLNVSGLIYLNSQSAKTKFGLRSDYRAVIKTLLIKILSVPGSEVCLIPHVMSQLGHYESDLHACQIVRDSIPAHLQSRVYISPNDLNEGEVKWLISQMDWFCGTRMHSAIAGLSSFVPTASIAYSGKTRGVFECCGVADHVADARSLETKDCVEKLVYSFDTRNAAKGKLQTTVPGICRRADDQVREMVEQLVDVRSSM